MALKNKELKANCIRNVDDVKEQSYLQPLIDNNEALPYVSCFDHETTESIPLWNMYAGHKYGVKIQFDFWPEKLLNGFSYAFIDLNRSIKGCRPGYSPVEFYQGMDENILNEYPKVWVYTLTSPIVYKSELERIEYQLPAANLINWSTLATVKSEYWKFQNEIRIIAFFSHIDHATHDEVEVIELPYFEYLLLPIHFCNIKKIVITFSPWMGQETKSLIKKSIEQIGIDCKFLFVNSCFEGILRKK